MTTHPWGEEEGPGTTQLEAQGDSKASSDAQAWEWGSPRPP